MIQLATYIVCARSRMNDTGRDPTRVLALA